jgi:hypothetical protein
MNGLHYLLENGRPIARFNTLAEAEAVRAEFALAGLRLELWTSNGATDGQENYPPGWPENWQAFVALSREG